MATFTPHFPKPGHHVLPANLRAWQHLGSRPLLAPGNVITTAKPSHTPPSTSQYVDARGAVYPATGPQKKTPTLFTSSDETVGEQFHLRDIATAEGEELSTAFAALSSRLSLSTLLQHSPFERWYLGAPVLREQRIARVSGGRAIYATDAIMSWAEGARTILETHDIEQLRPLVESASIDDAPHFIREATARYAIALQSVPLPPPDRMSQDYAYLLGDVVDHHDHTARLMHMWSSEAQEKGDMIDWALHAAQRVGTLETSVTLMTHITGSWRYSLARTLDSEYATAQQAYTEALRVAKQPEDTVLDLTALALWNGWPQTALHSHNAVVASHQIIDDLIHLISIHDATQHWGAHVSFHTRLRYLEALGLCMPNVTQTHVLATLGAVDVHLRYLIDQSNEPAEQRSLTTLRNLVPELYTLGADLID